MTLGCLFCPRRHGNKPVKIATRRGVCESCMVYIRHHHLDEEKLVKQGVLLPRKKLRQGSW